MEDDEVKLTLPYYKTTYLDDYNNTHIAAIQSDIELDFYKERFTVTSCEKVTNL